jgi:hypothetical protein
MHPKHRWLNAVPLNLIDCTTRTVNPYTTTGLPDEQLDYVALSYVWGKSTGSVKPADISLPFVILDDCSKTIEHAMQAVQELGLRCLWVDMYCFSTDAGIRHNQIGRMDLVYSRARFTMVAAFGNCAEDGLPGMGT